MAFDSLDDEDDVDVDDDEYLDDDTEDDMDNGSANYDDSEYDPIESQPLNEDTGNIFLDIKNRYMTILSLYSFSIKIIKY